MVSKHSIKSDWVEHELKAGEREHKEGRDVLCPVVLDDSWKTKVKSRANLAHLTDKLILDSSEWETESKFDEQFAKLEKGLRVTVPYSNSSELL